MITTGGIRPRAHTPAVSWGGNLPVLDATDLASIVLRAADGDRGEIRFVRDEGVESALGYGELVEAASRILGGIREHGAKRGDTVTIAVADDRDLLATFWACVLGGLVPLPLGVGGPRRTDLDGLWHQSDTVWAVGDTDDFTPARFRHLGSAAELESTPPTDDYSPGGWDDPAVLLLSLGGADTLKAVPLSHGNILSRTIATAHVNGLGPDERTFNWMPLDQAGGLIMSHVRDVYLGCDQIHAPEEWVLTDPLRWIDQLHRHRTTLTWAPNFAFELVNENATRMRDRRWDLRALARVMNGGEGTRLDVLKRFVRLLAPHGLPSEAVRPGWGKPETASVIVDWRPHLDNEPNDRFVAAGYPYPGVGLRIVNQFDEVLPEGELGLLEVTGEPVAAGYRGDPEANRRSFTKDRWFRTGELAKIERGRLTVTGRDGDSVVIGGNVRHGHDIERTVETVTAVEPALTVACAVNAPGDAEANLAVFYCPRADADPQVAAKEIREVVLRDHGLTVAHVIPIAEGDLPETRFTRLRRTLLAQRFEAGAFDSAVVESAPVRVGDR